MARSRLRDLVARRMLRCNFRMMRGRCNGLMRNRRMRRMCNRRMHHWRRVRGMPRLGGMREIGRRGGGRLRHVRRVWRSGMACGVLVKLWLRGHLERFLQGRDRPAGVRDALEHLAAPIVVRSRRISASEGNVHGVILRRSLGRRDGPEVGGPSRALVPRGSFVAERLDLQRQTGVVDLFPVVHDIVCEAVADAPEVVPS
mmetsp:Transcript_7906/g.22627  ORF Transcript_7906/g.22627 Transcript_7906/m.22627 type:complete len:200 (-) Transcript_7906:166-765(-)